MKILLRVIAFCNGLALGLPMTVVAYTVRPGLSGRTLAVMAALLCVMAVAGYATVQLWRLRHSGRYLTAALFAAWGLLWLVAVARGYTSTAGDIVELGVLGCVGSVLLLPAAKRACA
jgi:hypothetical protein